MAWVDGRKENGDSDIYAQRIFFTGGGALGGRRFAGCPLPSNRRFIRPWSPMVRAEHFLHGWILRGEVLLGTYMLNALMRAEQKCGRRTEFPYPSLTKHKSNPFIIQDGSDGVIILWYDARHGTYFNVYAQQVDRRGILGGDEFRFYTVDLKRYAQNHFCTRRIDNL